MPRDLLNCFVPAAGLGERLRPVTGLLPKPLLPVLGKPVLAYVLERLAGLPLRQIGINLHYKKEALRDWVEKSSFGNRVMFFPEDPVLDTGGALKNAEEFLYGSDVFLVHNSDVLSDIDLRKLIEAHEESGNLATLAVHDCPAEGGRLNTVELDREGYVRGVKGKASSCGRAGGPSADRLAAFTGIAVYNREFLEFLPAGRSGVVDAWVKAAASGRGIGTLDVTGSYWADIGSPGAYAAAVFEALKLDGETLYFNPGAEGCADAMLNGYVAVEKECVVRRGVSLRNCIVLPGSMPETGFHENCIIGPDFHVSFVEQDGGEASGEERTLIGTGGSDRNYFRVRHDGATAVMMQCAPGDGDFFRHLEYTRFFRKFSLPVPEIIKADAGNMTALFEDLGDLSLYSWLKCRRKSGQVERFYAKALDMLIKLHGIITAQVTECPLLAGRIFDHDHLRWETSYFVQRFVEGTRGMNIAGRQGLEDDFERLASKVAAFPRTIIHRDFQSQNIMVQQDENLRLIDYQGARMAPPAYDVVSLLWDPYYRLDDAARTRLLNHYMDGMDAACGPAFDAGRFMETLLPCRLQRHMQALGAYGFLSDVKGKKFFLKHVTGALLMLKEEAALARDEYPALYTLVCEL